MWFRSVFIQSDPLFFRLGPHPMHLLLKLTYFTVLFCSVQLLPCCCCLCLRSDVGMMFPSLCPTRTPSSVQDGGPEAATAWLRRVCFRPGSEWGTGSVGSSKCGSCRGTSFPEAELAECGKDWSLQRFFCYPVLPSL